MDINETYKKLTGVDVLEQNVRIGKVTNVTAASCFSESMQENQGLGDVCANLNFGHLAQ